MPAPASASRPQRAARLQATLWPHYFLEIGQNGEVLHLEFWAWGNDDEMAMSNLDAMVNRLYEVFGEIETELGARIQ